MFHLWNIKILKSNYNVTSRVNYGIEIRPKYPLNPPMYVDYQDLTINIGNYKFYNLYIFQIKGGFSQIVCHTMFRQQKTSLLELMVMVQLWNINTWRKSVIKIETSCIFNLLAIFCDRFEPIVLSICWIINHFGLDKSGIKGISIVYFTKIPLISYCLLIFCF